MRAPDALAALAALALLATTAPAFGYCRTRTCNSTDPAQHCEFDATGCVVSGHPVYWPTTCLTFDAQEDGSAKLGIDADTLTAVTERAFAPWLGADCGGGTPSLRAGTLGPVECHEAGRKSNEKGANVLMFDDDSWPMAKSINAFAFTTVTYDRDTGEIFDADIELNSFQFPLSADGGPGVDLQSVLTHELGHFLGLAHSTEPGSVMQQYWGGVGTQLRALGADDVNAICTIYAPNRRASSSCEPHNGFASACHVPADAPPETGCALGRKPARPDRAWLLWGALAAARAFRRSARRR